MAGQAKMSKVMLSEENVNNEAVDTSVPIITSNNLNAPKHGTVIPNRVFVGGISSNTTELDLVNLFSNYGTVTGTKIIQDRAGVSKGYGFVTFETEDEAKRLQKDADSIVLRDRRLNIAPAIKKQSFVRSGYDCTGGPNHPVQCPNQVYRHNGFTYTFHNGMAFFPQPPPQAIPSPTHVDTSPVFPQGNNFPVGQGNPGPAYPISFGPQGQVFYQSSPHHQYQFHVPQYDGCYDTSQMVVADGNLVLPQYIFTPQPSHEITYYQPAAVHSQEPAPSVQPIIYTPARPYDQPIIYTTEPKCGTENGLGGQNGTGIVTKEEADCSNNSTSAAMVTTTTTNNVSSAHISQNRRGREIPVISLNYAHQNNKDNYNHSRRKHHNQSDNGRRYHHLNNNNPDTANRNLNYGHVRNSEAMECRRTPPPVSSYSGGHMNSSHTPNTRPTPVQVPQFPFFHTRQVLAPSANLSSFFPPSLPAGQPPRPRSSYYLKQQRYQGGGGRSRGKWVAKEDEAGNSTLTPPITPRAAEPVKVGTTTTPPAADDVMKSMQALAI